MTVTGSTPPRSTLTAQIKDFVQDNQKKLIAIACLVTFVAAAACFGLAFTAVPVPPRLPKKPDPDPNCVDTHSYTGFSGKCQSYCEHIVIPTGHSISCHGYTLPFKPKISTSINNTLPPLPVDQGTSVDFRCVNPSSQKEEKLEISFSPEHVSQYGLFNPSDLLVAGLKETHDHLRTVCRDPKIMTADNATSRRCATLFPLITGKPGCSFSMSHDPQRTVYQI